MEAGEVLKQLEALEHPDYGHVYVEYGGSKDYRVAGYCKEGFWYYTDGIHMDRNYRCDSLQEALRWLADPPPEWMWDDNLEAQRREGIIP